MKPATPLHEMRVGKQVIHVEIVDTPETRRLGLMYRNHLPRDQGMLFVFPEDEVLQFWMRNTHIPLSIAFISADGIICRIADMEPFDETPCSSSVPVRYALEMNRGWFEEHSVKAGSRAVIPKAVRAGPPPN